jgi:cysteine desulfurase family protein (TIGR01976 family)
MIDINQVRAHFPSLGRTHNGKPLVYFDAPGGTQVTQKCIDRIVDYFQRCNANTHGNFITAHESDLIIDDAHEAAADFLNAESRDEIVFGQNMTTLAFNLSRSLGRWMGPGDEIILTKLDHDANFSPWHLMAEERGVKVHVVDINTDDCTLQLDDYERYLSSNTKLVCVGMVSNAVGTINPVKQIVGMAHAAGALTFVDAVAGAPHLSIDVRDIGTDFLACSPYKFWGAHQGMMYGRYELLDRLPAYKVRPADNKPPHKFQTGTQSHENQAGFIGIIEYLEWFAQHAGATHRGRRSARSNAIAAAMDASMRYEQQLGKQLIEGVKAIPGVKLYGIADTARMDERVPTIAIRVKDQAPADTSRTLGERGICVWDGNYYAINLCERLDVEGKGGMVRIGLTHYNSPEEVDRCLSELEKIAAAS